MHTKDFLEQELRAAGLISMADKAATGWYHDFMSPLDTPCIQLADDLTTYANAPSWPRKAEAQALLDRHLAGEFDASPEESAAWAASDEGKETIGKLTPKRGAKRPDPEPKAMDEIGRLALREEGEFWNAYYAKSHSMEDALHLGSVRMALIQTEERRTAFMDFMREAVSDIIQATVGVRPEWPDPAHPAPENERAGHA